MRIMSLSEARAALRDCSGEISPDARIRTTFTIPGTSPEDWRIAADSLSIPRIVSGQPGQYDCAVHVVRAKGEPELISSFRFEVESKPEPAPETEPVREAGSSSVEVLLALRQQDQEAHTREREFYERQLASLRDSHAKEISAIKDRYDAESRRERDNYEFRLDILRNNQATLDRDRDSIAENQKRLAMAELRAKAKGGDDIGLRDIVDLIGAFKPGGQDTDISKFKGE